jgi:hypothetical protein
MMADAKHAKLVREWLLGLAAATTVPADIEKRVRQIATFLADDFGDPGVFSDASLKAAAAGNDTFPSYGVLKTFLAAWWEQNRPRTTSGEPDDLDAVEMPEADRGMVRRWLSAHRMPANAKAVGDWTATAWPGDGKPVQPVWGQCPALVVDLSLIRRHAPAGYRWLLRHNQAAAAVAGKMTWAEADAPKPPPTDEQVAAVAALVANRVGRTTNGAGQPIPSGAPQPPNPAHQEALSRYASQIGLRGRRAGELSREQLDAVWEAAGATRPVPGPGKGVS